jgi:hypothetical protein
VWMEGVGSVHEVYIYQGPQGMWPPMPFKAP